MEPEDWQDDGYSQYDQLEEQLLRRATARVSEMFFPKRLRFSCAGQGNQARANGTEKTSHPLQVYIRIRPPGHSKAVCIRPLSDTELQVQPPPKKGNANMKAGQVEHYTFSRVFDDKTTQQDMYKATTASMVKDMLEFRAKSSVVMAYGSSGAGKTYTIEGSQDCPGLIPQALQQVLEYTQQEGKQMQVSMSYFEVYNKQVYDLLEPPASGSNNTTANNEQAGMPVRPKPGPKPLRHALLAPQDGQRRPLKIREDSTGQVVIPGLTSLPVTSAEVGLEIQRKAATQRQQAATGVNNHSSRSHCVFMIHVSEPATQAGAANPRTASLSLVDLAGSERASRTGNQGDRLKESCSINSSLTALGHCLEALRANQAGRGMIRVVPYRVSKLTYLFRDVLHGQGHLALLVATSPLAEDIDETSQVLRYAATAAGITLEMRQPQPPPQPVQTTLDEAAQAMRITQLEARVQELEHTLQLTSVELADTQAALEAAEADVRSEVVEEVGCVIQDLRGVYETQLEDLRGQLTERDAQIEALQRKLQEAGQTQKSSGKSTSIAKASQEMPIPSPAVIEPTATVLAAQASALDDSAHQQRDVLHDMPPEQHMEQAMPQPAHEHDDHCNSNHDSHNNDGQEAVDDRKENQPPVEAAAGGFDQEKEGKKKQRRQAAPKIHKKRGRGEQDAEGNADAEETCNHAATKQAEVSPPKRRTRRTQYR